MAELRDAGAVGFSDDGLPIVERPRDAPRAPVPAPRAAAQIALHEEDHDLSRPAAPTSRTRGVMHEGVGLGALGLAGVPSVAESTMIARDAALAAYEDARIHVQHLSARESVEAVAAAKRRRRADHLRGDAAPPDADRRGGQGPRLALQDEPAASHRGRPPGADRGVRSGVIDCIATDHAPHSHRGEGGAVRAGGDGRHRARDGVRGAPHRARGPRGARARRCWSSGWAPAPRRSGSSRRASRAGSEANLVLFDPEAEWEAGRRAAGRAGRRTRASPGAAWSAAS